MTATAPVRRPLVLLLAVPLLALAAACGAPNAGSVGDENSEIPTPSGTPQQAVTTNGPSTAPTGELSTGPSTAPTP